MPRGEPIQALVRGLEILEAVNRSAHGLSLSQIAERTGLKTTTAHNLVRTLIHKDYLSKQSHPVRYRVGSAVASLIRDFSGSSFLDRGAEVLKAFVARETSADALITEYVHGEVAVRIQVRPERPTTVERPRDRTMHPYGSASAVMFHALLSDEEREAFGQRHPFWEFGAHLWGSEDEFEVAVARARERQLAAPWKRKHHGKFPVAAPVLGPHNEPIAVFGASIPSETLEEGGRRAFVNAVRATAEELSEKN
jgi:IclR family acetate operon transcriptional repressor